MLPKNRLNEKRLRAAIREAFNCKQGAESIALAFKKAGGAGEALNFYKPKYRYKLIAKSAQSIGRLCNLSSIHKCKPPFPREPMKKV